MTAALLMVALVTSAAAAAPSTKYRIFGSNVTEGPSGTFTIVNAAAADYRGVYIGSKSNSSTYIGSVSFAFTSIGDVSGGAPRFSLSIDTDGNGSVDFYALLDVNGCGGVSGGTTVVSTSSSTCAVFAGNETFPNWAAFVAAHPTYRIAPGNIPFIIADGSAGTYVVKDIVLREPPADQPRAPQPDRVAGLLCMRFVTSAGLRPLSPSDQIGSLGIHHCPSRSMMTMRGPTVAPVEL